MIEYSTGTPTEDGVYACRVASVAYPTLFEDVFLFLLNGRWTFMDSDMPFRGEVPYWIGPLRRRMDANATDK